MNPLKFIIWGFVSILFATFVLNATGNAGLAMGTGILINSMQFVPMPAGILGDGAPTT